jgi:hypothetical protein
MGRAEMGTLLISPNDYDCGLLQQAASEMPHELELRLPTIPVRIPPSGLHRNVRRMLAKDGYPLPSSSGQAPDSLRVLLAHCEIGCEL